jgi:hypothetical protein
MGPVCFPADNICNGLRQLMLTEVFLVFSTASRTPLSIPLVLPRNISSAGVRPGMKIQWDEKPQTLGKGLFWLLLSLFRIIHFFTEINCNLQMSASNGSEADTADPTTTDAVQINWDLMSSTHVFIYLFIYGLTTPLVIPTLLQRRMVRWSMNGEMHRIWKEAIIILSRIWGWLIRRGLDWMIGFIAPYTFTTRDYR